MQATRQLFNASSRAHSTGFLGVGRMGAHMINNLIVRGKAAKTGKPTRYVICDPEERCIASVVQRHQKENPDIEIHVAKNPYEVALEAATIVSMIPKLTHVQSVYTSTSSPSILSALKSGELTEQQVKETICMDESTIEMEGSREVCRAIEATGAGMVDAPVSGGVYGAEQGTLTIMVGASSAAQFERARPTLEMMSKRVIHCGDLGAGLAAKICNNMMLGISMLGLSEAMLLGKKLGLDQQILGDIINTSTGQSWASSTNFPVPHVQIGSSSPAAHRGYKDGFLTQLAHKDLVLALSAAKAVDSPLYVGELTEKVYSRMMQDGDEFANRDFSVVYKWLEEVVKNGSAKL
ncbi:hypothetical protein QFC21_005834 [Naganishia friedmannii]|uniref:Uncharacterized protein n=1 Tax=Naganishia friedmannii TaxID=89922 RepID=A0ACC2V6Q7_9TREE|nr:hypothetical protein QFC21_005834 [Naganishia friedmannii]